MYRLDEMIRMESDNLGDLVHQFAEVLVAALSAAGGVPRSTLDVRRAFLGVSAGASLSDEVVRVPPCLRDARLYALQRFVEEIATEFRPSVRRYEDVHGRAIEVPPAHRQIEVDQGVYLRCLESGTIFLEGSSQRFTIDVSIDEDWTFGAGTLLVRFTWPETIGRLKDEIPARFREACRRHHIYRGKKIVCRGDSVSFLPPHPTSWGDLILPAPVMEAIRNHVLLLAADPAGWVAVGLEPRRSVLLSGPPGAGKTLIGRVLASEVRTSFVWVTAQGLQCPDQAAHLMDLAREVAPVIVLVEDLDVVAGGRQCLTFGELLAQTDGLVRNDGVILIATTNDPEALDEALQRPGRFDVHLRIDPPDEVGRARMLARFLGDVPVSGRDDWLASLVLRTEGFTGANLRELVTSAKIHALARSRADGAPASVPTLTTDDFDRAFEELPEARSCLGLLVPEARRRA